MGAEPLVVLTDLAEFVHFVTKLKYVPDAGRDRSLSETERDKGAQFANRLSVRVLGRAWQILLKGIAEVRTSDRPLQAADMVLIRLTHAAELPTPEELIRKLQDSPPHQAPSVSPSANGAGKPGPVVASATEAPASGATVPGGAVQMVASAQNQPRAIGQSDPAPAD